MRDLADYRNGEDALSLATFLGRYWSVASRLEGCFPIDRRALSNHRELGLSESKVRGAIKTLERVGFISRAIRPKGSVHKMTDDGELRRKPVMWSFGSEFMPLFNAAIRRSKAKQEPRARQPQRRMSALNSPKKNPSESSVLMGQIVKGLSERRSTPIVPSPALEDALERFRRAILKDHH